MAFLYQPLTWLNDACLIFRDAKGEALAYVYFKEEPGRSGLLTYD
jgi:hypothetical protein